MTDKLDLSKADQSYYTAKQHPAVAEFGALPFLMIDGQGDPDGAEFAEKTEALYQLAYGIKGMCKAQGNDFVVPKLEGLWWVTGERDGLQVPRSEWQWQLLIRMPPFVSRALFTAAQAATATKKQNDCIHDIVFDQLAEGVCAHILHVGPFSDEPKTIAQLHSFIHEHGLQISGTHENNHSLSSSIIRRVPMQTGTPQTKADVLDLIRSSHGALEQAVAQLTDEQLSAPNEGGWSIKDHLAHITAWEQVLLRAHIGGESYAQALGRAEPLPENTIVDDVNEWVYQQNKSKTLTGTRDAFDQSYQQALDAIGQMSEVKLLTEHSKARPDAMLIETVAENTWEHYDEHTATIRRLIAEGNEQQR